MYRILTVHIVGPKHTCLICAARISRIFCITNVSDTVTKSEAKTPERLGSAADHYHLVQNCLLQYNFNCLYVTCITDWCVLLVNSSIITVIRLQNNYKQKNYISLRVLI
jgi:hypothetical protein